MMLRLSKNPFRGKLIVYEGTDGAGKTTLIRLTESWLAEKYGESNVLVQKQPTDLSRKTKLFQKMMYCPNHSDINYRAVQLLTLSDRIQHNTEIIIPALKQGKYVICDRYLYTSIANMWARGYSHEKWFFYACREIIKPDIAFLAYVKPELAIKRIKSRPEESARHLNEPLLNKVSESFLKYHKLFDLKVIQTDQDALKAFEVIKDELKQRGI